MIETPYFRMLKGWREEHGFVTDEWRAYVRASKFQTLILYVFGVILGGLLGFRVAMLYYYLNP